MPCGFLSQAYRDAYKADHARIEKEIGAKAKERCGSDLACREDLEAIRLEREYIAAGRLPRVDWTSIVDHIDHAVKLVGAEHVGLGSDFDGATTPAGMEDASHLPRITDALLEKGYSSRDIQNILGGSTLRVMREVEATASRLRRQAEH